MSVASRKLTACERWDVWHGPLSAGNGPLFIAVYTSMYGMQQHNYSLLYYTHLNTPDSINTHSCQTSSPRTAEHGQRLYGGFHLNWLTFGYTVLPAITTALITFIRCSYAWVRCKNRHFGLARGQSFVLNLSCDSLKAHKQSKSIMWGIPVNSAVWKEGKITGQHRRPSHHCYHLSTYPFHLDKVNTVSPKITRQPLLLKYHCK